jgi:hypothetical protein
MDQSQLTKRSLDLSDCRFEEPQTSGVMTVLPLCRPDCEGDFSAPLSGLKLAGVKGYGNVVLQNYAPSGVSIVPLHVGYIQDQAQNHALCRSAFIGAGQSMTFNDACCVQQSQGGYLKEADQWFFILPLPLRQKALELSGVVSYGKLWGAIAHLNQKFGMDSRGHLEQLICRRRPYLTQYASRFELVQGQVGALFFLKGNLAGVEVAPTARYFRETWFPLVCFCYGPAAMLLETGNGAQHYDEPLSGSSLETLRKSLQASRRERSMRIAASLEDAFAERMETESTDKYLSLQLATVKGKRYSGQVVRDQNRLVYASVFLNEEFFQN